MVDSGAATLFLPEHFTVQLFLKGKALYMLIRGSFIGQESFVARSKDFLPAHSPTPWFLTKGLITTSNSMLPHFWSIGAVIVRKAEKTHD